MARDAVLQAADIQVQLRVCDAQGSKVISEMNYDGRTDRFSVKMRAIG